MVLGVIPIEKAIRALLGLMKVTSCMAYLSGGIDLLTG